MADNAGTIITATLSRGKTYSHFIKEEGKFKEFKRNVPTEVSDELADELEELVEIITTTDGDEVEKPRFEIDREAEKRQDDEPAPRRMRLRMVAADEDRKPKTVATRTAPVPGRGTGLKVGGSRR